MRADPSHFSLAGPAQADAVLSVFKSPLGLIGTTRMPMSAQRIWQTRFDEPDPLPRHGLSCFAVLSDDEDKAPIQARQVWRLASQSLSRKQYVVLCYRYALDMTLPEIAERLDLSRERIRQIEMEALALLRKALKLPKPLHHPCKRLEEFSCASPAVTLVPPQARSILPAPASTPTATSKASSEAKTAPMGSLWLPVVYVHSKWQGSRSWVMNW